MILLLIARICVTVFSLYSLNLGLDNGKDGFVLFGTLGVAIGVVGLVVYVVLIFGYVSAGYKADLINREYQTNYTQQEVFYASDVIDTIREIDRKRIEINGDLMRDPGHRD